MTTAATMPLVGGVLAFDLVNTASGRGADDPDELLRRPRDLVEWAVHAGALAPDAAPGLISGLEKDAGEGVRVLRAAWRTRETIRTAGLAIATGRPTPPAALRALSAAAGEAVAAADLRLSPDGGYILDFSAGRPEVALLGQAAWSALELLRRGRFERIKSCPACGWLFVDHSKNNSRRWCEMSSCGNHEKARRHRSRAAGRRRGTQLQ